jgi:hypothetical protein
MLDPEHRVLKILKPVPTPSTVVVATGNLKNKKFVLVTKNHKKMSPKII